MFGYVRAYKPDLTFRQYDIYKGVYCSLCKTLGRRYGLLARMTLSYDFAFFALVRMSLLPECTPFHASRCSFRPTKKCLQCAEPSAELAFTADISMLAVYYKFLDNLDDGGPLRRFALRLISPYFRHIYKKAKKNCPAADTVLAQMYTLQREVEAQPPQIDAAAHPSAQALGKLLTLECAYEDTDTLYRFGYAIGRWVYLVDAADDYADDKKHDGFNPFLPYAPAQVTQKARDALNLTAGETVHLFEQLQIRHYKPILSNILYDGMHETANRVLQKERV